MRPMWIVNLHAKNYEIHGRGGRDCPPASTQMKNKYTPGPWRSVPIENSSPAPVPDMVNRPPHYTFGTIEVINVIEDWKLGFMLGNAIKYIARAPHKGSYVENLKKARWYLDREITKAEKIEKSISRSIKILTEGN